MKFKFKITDQTSFQDALNEINKLYNANINEIPFNHIIKIAEFIGAELQKSPPGSMERFKHPAINTFGNFFSVHVIHGGKNEVMVQRANFRKYLFPYFKAIIENELNKKE